MKLKNYKKHRWLRYKVYSHRIGLNGMPLIEDICTFTTASEATNHAKILQKKYDGCDKVTVILVKEELVESAFRVLNGEEENA